MNRHATNSAGEESPIISPRAEQNGSNEDLMLSSENISDAQRELDARGFSPATSMA
jgi:hypothetical protein